MRLYDAMMAATITPEGHVLLGSLSCGADRELDRECFPVTLMALETRKKNRPCVRYAWEKETGGLRRI